MQDLWGQTTLRVWLPTQNIVVQLHADSIGPLLDAQAIQPASLLYTVAAARVADTLTQNILLAPVETAVVPLPHQIWALTRATAGDQVRYLLADEVGLGKTIEAGLIIRELKLRGLIRRILVIAPRGLVTQWISEMETHFSDKFHLMLPGDFAVQRRSVLEENLWKVYDQVVCPMDAVKPLDKRRGWSREQLAAYNQERFEGLVSAGWDLVIVDEAHRLSGSTDQVARYRLGQSLAETTPYLLLLSATPHQGKSDAFQRLVALLDPTAFAAAESMQKERVQPYIIRTEKRRAIDAQGQPLFKPRQTRLVPISWQPQHQQQRMLYEAVTDYVKEGYNQALKEKKSYLGFLMILMQRLVTSSTRAIHATLTRRLDALRTPEEQTTLFAQPTLEEWSDLDAQEQVDRLFQAHLAARKNERAEVEMLLEVATRAQEAGPDAKAETLLEWIYRLQQEEVDPRLKILIFTEFVPTQEMLSTFLHERAFAVTTLNGSMDMEARKAAQQAFATTAQILISTDAGGEGLNLQYAHIVINYDIPWNPMRLEQRIGRVDRIGQKHTVHALNFALEDTVEYRVREVLETKLTLIFKELGIDKMSDVLDSVQSGQMFDHLYIETLLHVEKAHERIETLVEQVHEQVKSAQATASVLETGHILDPMEAQKIIDHPLAYWIERMVVAYLQTHGGIVKKTASGYELGWPTGEAIKNVLFSAREAELNPSTTYLSLEDQRIRVLAERISRFVAGQPIASIVLPGLPPEVQGFWSLWQISILAADWRKQRILPLFLHDNGRVLQPTARYIWDKLLTDAIDLHHQIAGQEARQIYERVWLSAKMQGKASYEELAQLHQSYLQREREKAVLLFAARRRAVSRVGLTSVKAHRLALIDQEERHWRAQLDKRAQINPDMYPLLIIRVTAKKEQS